MNRLFLTAAVAALILPAAACNDERTQADADATADETTVAEAETDTAIDEARDTTSPDTTTADPMDTYPTTADTTTDTTGLASVGTADHLMAGEISAKYALDATILGANGQKVADVDDLQLDQSGKIVKVVFNEGGDKRAVDFATAKLTPTDGAEGDALVKVGITEEQADAAAPFEQEGLNDYSLASELLGAEVDIAASDDDEARITDIIFDASGMAKDLIVQRSAVGISAGDHYAFDYSKLQIAEGDAGLVLNVSETELNEANKFEYSMDDAAEEATDADADDVDTPDPDDSL